MKTLDLKSRFVNFVKKPTIPHQQRTINMVFSISHGRWWKRHERIKL